MKIVLFRDLPSERWWSMERYADELYNALCSLNIKVKQYTLSRWFPKASGVTHNLLNYIWRLLIYPLAARTQRGDINHILDHSYAHLAYLLPSQGTVITCHDLAPLAFPEQRRGLSYQIWRFALAALPKAKHILADSAYTRMELIQNTPIAPERIHVVPLGVRLPATNGESQPRTDNLILHVGACAPRKNVTSLLRALALVPQACLVQVGGQWNVEQEQLIVDLNLATRVQQLGHVSETQLAHYYRTASVFVFPSLYEGFGLPILEAMATGLPVICSNATSLPEVAGEAALLFNPTDINMLAEHIQNVLNDSTERHRLRIAGWRQAQVFTWERTAQATLAVYNRLII